MNILLVYHELGFRGGEKLFLNLAKGLILKKHKVTLVAGRINKDKLELPKNLKLVSPPKILNSLFQNNWLFVFISIPVTFFNIIRTKFDVIYTGEVFSVFYPSLFASLITSKKLVLSVFELKKAFLLNKVKYATTINSALIPLLKKSGVKNLYHIPAGIDFSIYKNPNLQNLIKKYNLKNKKVILMVGVIHPAKKQDIAIRALRLVKKKIPNAVLILAGGGDISKLKFQISNLKFENQIILTGFVNDKDIRNYYSIADVCLMCGPIGGLTVVESLYFGKNIIYPTSGTPPLGPVEEHNLGIILKDKSVKSYAEKIIDVLKHPKKYQAKLEKDRKFVTKTFSLEKFTKSTLQVLQKISYQKST